MTIKEHIASMKEKLARLKESGEFSQKYRLSSSSHFHRGRNRFLPGGCPKAR